MGVDQVHTQLAVVSVWPFQSKTSLQSPTSGASWVSGHIASSVPHSGVALPFSPGKPSPALGWSNTGMHNAMLCVQAGGIPH